MRDPGVVFGAELRLGGVVWFGAFRFDPVSGRLSRDGDVVEVPLRPKTASVLGVLVSRSGEVVSKRDLLATVWPDGFVGDAVLARCVNELRQVLGDDPREPGFIATIHRRGYRFVAAVSSSPDLEPGPSSTAGSFVGRGGELAELNDRWRQARDGERQVVFVAAEGGVGKTTLVDVFVDGLRDDRRVLVGRGQCVERFGAGEPYLPLLDALFGLCRGPDGHRVVEALRSVGPTWLLHLSGVVDPAEVEGLRVRAVGMSEERMLRELGVALEAITAERPLVLVFEDLHLGDRATTEALGYLARRREPARLMLIGTYRPDAAVSRGRALRRVVADLRAHDQCRFVALELLSRSAVGAYLTERLTPRRASEALIDDVHERTDGNALFVTTMVDHLVERDLLGEVAGELRPRDRLDRLGIPDSLGEFIERQVDVLDAQDRQLLEVAAAAGVEFTTETVRAGASADRPDLQAAEVESRLSSLAREVGMVTEGEVCEWPDGTLTARYRFGHGLYREVLYGHLSPTRRVAIHRRIGDRLAAAHGSGAAEIAAELAEHFERGHDVDKAIPFFVEAAQTAQRRVRERETLDYATRGLRLLDRAEPTAERAALELRLRMLQVVSMVSLRGLRGEGVGDAYRQTRALCSRIEDPTLLGPVLYGLWRVADAGGTVSEAAEIGDEFTQLAQRVPDPVLRLQAHYIAGVNHSAAGRFADEVFELKRCLELYDPVAHRHLALRYSKDPAVAAHTDLGWVTWYLGYPDQAREHARQACVLARDLGYPNEIFEATGGAGAVSAFCRDVDRVREYVDTTVRAHHHYGLTRSIYHLKVLDGWALAQVGEPPSGISVLPDGPAELSAGARTNPLLNSMRAETFAARGDTAAALAAATEALDIAHSTGDLDYESELVRLRGELLLRANPPRSTGADDVAAEAEQAFIDALDIARGQQAKSLELRAATSLARLWQSRGDRHQARELLAPIYDWFTEGHDTHDLKHAAALLAELD